MSTIFERNHYRNPSAQEQDRRGRSLGYTGPNSQYGYAGDSGWSWYSGAASNWSAGHRIDPNTGMIVSNDGSPTGAPPGQIALQWQAAHEQAVYGIRNRLMQSAAKYGQGNLRLMQSFRPGGGATIEANTYGQMAGIQLNRANMTQPLDYLGDYRKQAGDKAEYEARKAQSQQQIISAGITVGSIVAGALTGGAGTALVAGLASAGSLFGSGKGGGSGMSPNQSTYGQSPEAQRAGFQLQYGGNDNMAPPGQNLSGSGPRSGPNQQGQPYGGTDLSRPGGGNGLASRGEPDQQQPGQGLPGQGGRAASNGGQLAGQGGPQGGGAQMAFADSPFAGADGNFTSTAYAAAGSQRLNPVTQTLLLRQVADRATNDPFYDSFAMTVDIEMARRMPQVGAA